MRPLPRPAGGGVNSYTIAELEELAELLTPESPALEGVPVAASYNSARHRARTLQLGLRRIGLEVHIRTWPQREESGEVRWYWAVYLPDG